MLRYFGALKDLYIDWSDRKKRMKEFRSSFDKHIAETNEKMEKLRRLKELKLFLIDSNYL